MMMCRMEKKSFEKIKEAIGLVFKAFFVLDFINVDRNDVQVRENITQLPTSYTIRIGELTGFSSQTSDI